MGGTCVLLYRLGGYPPFSDEIKEHSLHDQICNGIYSFPTAYWSEVSEEGKSVIDLISYPLSLSSSSSSSSGIDLIKRLLTVDSSKRWTTAQALEHTWLKVRERRGGRKGGRERGSIMLLVFL